MILKILLQPYPKEWKLTTGFRMAFVSGLIVAAFFLVFKPFDIYQTPVQNI